MCLEAKRQDSCPPIASASVAPTSVGIFMNTFWLFCVPSWTAQPLSSQIIQHAEGYMTVCFCNSLLRRCQAASLVHKGDISTCQSVNS